MAQRAQTRRRRTTELRPPAPLPSGATLQAHAQQQLPVQPVFEADHAGVGLGATCIGRLPGGAGELPLMNDS